jgi:hypothetical protein
MEIAIYNDKFPAIYQHTLISALRIIISVMKIIKVARNISK